MNYNEAFERLIGHEGNYTDNPKDPGNWTSGKAGVGKLSGTKYGISASAYPLMDIKSISLDQAKAIYRKDYWDRIQADYLPPALAFQVFDAAVNHGPTRAAKLLQRAAKVDEDGIIGPKTLGAVGKLSQAIMLLRFNAARAKFYTSLDTFKDFGRGWTNRVADNLNYAADDIL